MFCRKCGKELEENWIQCPYCGEVIDEEINKEPEKEVKSETEKAIPYIGDDRKEIKEYLASNFKSNSTVWGYGTGAISRDIKGRIERDEEILDFQYGYRNGILGLLKSGRLFRNYFLFTSKRIIYIEKTQRIFSLLFFLHKYISIPYNEIQSVEAGKAIGIYSGKLKITCRKNLEWRVLGYKEAQSMKNFIEQRV